MNENKDIKFYTEDELMELVRNLEKERLVFIDDGIDEVIGKFNDLPDIIVDFNRRFGTKDLKIFEFAEPTEIPIITTKGEFLDKCNPKDRELIIERLIKLQTNQEEIKDYLLIDEVEFVDCCQKRDEER